MKYSDLNQLVSAETNMTENQRLVSAVTGGLVLAMGIFGFGKSSFRRALRMTAGSLLIIRGVTGYCPVSAAINKVDQPSLQPTD